MTAPWKPAVGECLLIESGPIGKHLFILVKVSGSGNHQKVVSVPVCSVPNHPKYDDACLLAAGEHSFVTHDSFIDYRYAREDDASHLEKCVASGTFVTRGTANATLLAKVKAGVAQSKFVSRYFKKLI